MKKIKNVVFLMAILLLSMNVNGQNKSDNVLPTKERSSVVEMQGTITELNKETREITLAGERGEMLTFVADDAVKRFKEFEVGDIITIEYDQQLMVEFREPTAEELAEPLVIDQDGEVAADEMDPGAAVASIVKAVVTIEVINRPYMIVVIRGPEGNFVTLDVEDEELIQKLHVGQVVILTYTEIVAISLEHQAAKKK